MSVPGRVRHLNPEGLPRNPAFTNVVEVDGPVTTIYIGGQNAVTAADEIVGKDGIAAQTEQVFRKLDLALTAAGATLENVVKWTMHVVEGHPIQPAFAVFQKVWGGRPNPPVITMVRVAGLANPDFLVELEAATIVPRQNAG
jgi:enamine deaminase RidA (YjgF/YER057c/UK114 family)